jgi:signal transduction histidine kinase
MESLVNEGGRDRLRLLRKQLELMGKSLHHVAWELRPASIDELGLASALSNYVSEWGSQIDIAADFHCSVGKLDELADDVRTTIYRLVQEGLTNIAKHAAGATAVSVVIDRTDKVLRLAIEDNGPGFDSTPPAETAGERKNAGLGLAGMRERLSLIGGEVEIESSIGIGTTIYIRIPVANERATV